MLKRITARNFLSLQDVEIDLRPRNVLVGPNMSGKSNLIECLRFVQEAVGRREANESSALQQAVSRRGGFEEVSWKGQAGGPISITLMAELEGADNHTTESYTYEFCLGRGPYGHFKVNSEKLNVIRNAVVKPLIENADGKLKVMQQGQWTESAQRTLDLALELYGPSPDSECHPFWNFVQTWRFYHLVPALMRQSNPPSWEKCLGEHGENLSVWLLTLQNYPDEFNGIKQTCRDVFPGVAEILFQPVKRKTPISPEDGGVTGSFESPKISVGVGETHFKSPVSISRMSDGELAFLALVSLILTPDELSPSLLCIEEPENHLHPHMLEILVELLNQQQLYPRAPQIIATTHSPVLVDKLTIDDLIVTERTNGATRFSRPSSKRYLKKLLSDKELGLGDLWYSGALGSS
jgi:predicted ATPase